MVTSACTLHLRRDVQAERLGQKDVAPLPVECASASPELP